MNFINLIDLYTYSLFDDIVIPAGVDKETLINTILDKCRTSEPLYTDENLLKMKIKNFFNKYERTFNRLYVAYSVDYNMTNNYDRTEQHTTTRNNVDTVKVAPYDSSEFENDTQTSNNDIAETQSRVFGNIGVMTAAEMLDREIKLIPKLNIYEIIANIFYSEFCVYVM